MKTMTFKTLALALFALPSIAVADASEKTLARIQDQFMGLEAMGIEHYSVSFHYGKEAIEVATQHAKSCQTNAGFKNRRAEALATRIEEVLFEGLSLALDQGIIDMDDGWYGAHESIRGLAEDLAGELDVDTVEVCSHKSIPSYSDGHETVIVKVNGQPQFAFEVGRPD